MLSQSQLEKLLGRSLTPLEAANMKSYLRLAATRLEQLLCMNLCGDDSDRIYDGRIGYKLQYVDPLTSVQSVKVNGQEVAAADYILKQWDNRNAAWFNVIEFKREITGDVEVSADWGFPQFPDDLALLLTKLFAQNTTEQTTKEVKSKKIEDFTVTYADSTSYSELVNQNAAVIAKYSLCNLGGVRSGCV